MSLHTAALCENHLRIIHFQIAEDLAATFHFDISSVANPVAPIPQGVTDRSVAICS